MPTPALAAPERIQGAARVLPPPLATRPRVRSRQQDKAGLGPLSPSHGHKSQARGWRLSRGASAFSGTSAFAERAYFLLSTATRICFRQNVTHGSRCSGDSPAGSSAPGWARREGPASSRPWGVGLHHSGVSCRTARLIGRLLLLPRGFIAVCRQVRAVAGAAPPRRPYHPRIELLKGRARAHTGLQLQCGSLSDPTGCRRISGRRGTAGTSVIC
jgi:hypothetical protein